jgi:hypothetical protein
MSRWDLLYVAGTLASLFVPIIIAFGVVLSGKQKEAQDAARARRMAEYRMNARLLRLNI